MEKPDFTFGTNIALKIPAFRFNETIAFYRDTLGMNLKKYEHAAGESYFCEAGAFCVWFDLVENYSQTDIWLEITAGNISRARTYLNDIKVPFRPELEKLPEDLDASWISDPAGVVLLLKDKNE